ncbi:MAG TPA: hypothetical protein VH702_08105 [Vicinamibacterales bacterium]|jgi:hypothetical protein
MRRCFVTVFILAVLVLVSSSVWALPILDIDGLVNRALVESRYRGIADDSSQLTMPSSDEGAAFAKLAGSGTDSAFLDTTMVTVLSNGCGSEAAGVLGCLDAVNMALPGAQITVGSRKATEPSKVSDEPPVDQRAEDANTPRGASATITTVFILLTTGLAAAGFAGWRTFLKGRRFTKGRRRDAGRRRRSGSTSVF